MRVTARGEKLEVEGVTCVCARNERLKIVVRKWSKREIMDVAARNFNTGLLDECVRMCDVGGLESGQSGKGRTSETNGETNGE